MSIVVTLLAALLFAAEVFNRPMLSRAFARGVSQNVVAKYEPGYSAETGGSRRRKVIVVSRYDSGKVNAEPTNLPQLDLSHPAMGYVRRHGIPASAADRS